MNYLFEKIIIVFSWLCMAILILSMSGLFGYLLLKGYHVLSVKLIFGDIGIIDALLLRRPVVDGLFPALAGTIIVVGFSVLLATPIGIAGGVYLAEYAGERFKNIFTLMLDILAGLPSIVIGLFGFSIAIVIHKYLSDKIYPSLLISSLTLAFLVLPYIIRATQLSLNAIPENVRLTAVALGATSLQNIFIVLLPRSLSGIISGLILAIGRCAEDTAVIMLTGAVASAGIPNSILDKYEALPFYIYYISSQYTNREELATGYGAAIILLIICIALFTLALVSKRIVSQKILYGFERVHA